MQKKHNSKASSIVLVATCASMPDDIQRYELTIPKGTALIDFMANLANDSEYISNFIFNTKEGRMYPYHLLFVEDKLFLPKELDTYIIQDESLFIKVVPFVSGG